MNSIVYGLLHAYYRSGWRGFYFLNRLLNRGRLLTAANSYGVLFRLRPASYIDSFVLRAGYYESEIIEYLRAHLQNDFVFWDIGANFGLHAVTVQTLFPASQVVAFEPLPLMRKRIEENAGLNGVTVRLRSEALSDSNSPGVLYTDRTGSEGRSSLIPDPTILPARQAVTCARLDTLLDTEDLPFPDCIKIDVEGAEERVLAGLGRFIHDERLRHILFEAANDLGIHQNVAPIVRSLHNAGFVIEQLPRREATAHALSNFAAARML